MYEITQHSKEQAKRLGVEIKPSTSKGKKIDVYKNGQKVATIGDIRYSDYGTYKRTKGKTYADERRRLYKIRHKNDLQKKNGFYASEILW